MVLIFLSDSWQQSESVYFPKCQTLPLRDVYLLFSLWHLARALQRLGSGHRSRGDWPFLLRMVRSAPLAARKHAMDAALFFSAPWVPKPMINCGKTDTQDKWLDFWHNRLNTVGYSVMSSAYTQKTWDLTPIIIYTVKIFAEYFVLLEQIYQ